MTERVINVAVIGYGGMGKKHTLRLKELPEFNIKGIYDIKAERSELARCNGLYAFSSLDEVINCKDIDLVIVAIPNDQHKDVCIKFMNAGKNVICEKPVAMSVKEFDEMERAAAENSVLFTVHQNRRWDKDYLTARRVIESGVVGDVFTVESRVHGSRGIPGDWRNEKRFGGGMLFDWGIHLLDQILMIENGIRITEISAQFEYITNPECEDGFTVFLRFENGRKYRVEVGTHNFIGLPRWYILGNDGTAVIDDWYANGKIALIKDWSTKDVNPVVTASGPTKTMAPRSEDDLNVLPLPEVNTDVLDYYRNVRQVLLGNEEIIVKCSEIRRCMCLVEAIFKSAEEHITITNFDGE